MIQASSKLLQSCVFFPKPTLLDCWKSLKTLFVELPRTFRGKVNENERTCYLQSFSSSSCHNNQLSSDNRSAMSAKTLDNIGLSVADLGEGPWYSLLLSEKTTPTGPRYKFVEEKKGHSRRKCPSSWQNLLPQNLRTWIFIASILGGLWMKCL